MKWATANGMTEPVCPPILSKAVQCVLIWPVCSPTIRISAVYSQAFTLGEDRTAIAAKAISPNDILVTIPDNTFTCSHPTHTILTRTGYKSLLPTQARVSLKGNVASHNTTRIPHFGAQDVRDDVRCPGARASGGDWQGGGRLRGAHALVAGRESQGGRLHVAGLHRHPPGDVRLAAHVGAGGGGDSAEGFPRAGTRQAAECRHGVRVQRPGRPPRKSAQQLSRRGKFILHSEGALISRPPAVGSKAATKGTGY
eukprot:3470768-Pyramimonas_sp.AAC.2